MVVVRRALQRNCPRTPGNSGRHPRECMARPKRGNVCGSTHSIPGMAEPGSPREQRPGSPAWSRRRRLQHRAGRDAHSCRACRQSRHTRGTGGNKLLRNQHNSHPRHRGGLCPHVGAGRHHDGDLPNGLRGGVGVRPSLNTTAVDPARS
ncbi:Uncharacterised protein [Mycobacteroides abscessus subsp. abscessus]|nr:Uncharacterised protein [Mycobacteroides abscessus subsp. abscessus]